MNIRKHLNKCIKFFVLIKSKVFFSAMLKGSAAGIEHASMLKKISCRHVVDIGANRGQFALMARHCFPEARIDSFEPLDEPRKTYQSVFSADEKTRLHPYAIGPEKSEATIHVSAKDDSSSLLPISSIQTDLFPESIEKETRIIQVVPLDAVLNAGEINSPALLKIDVQGFELSALHGCSSLLGRFAYAYIECSFVELYEGQSLANEVIAYMGEQKFRLVGVYNVYYDKDGIAIQADFLFQYAE